jgi:hypothetical protein
MNATRPPRSPTIPPNPAHNRQTIWQIWMPLVAAFLLIVFIAVLATGETMGSAEMGGKFASISIIWLILPVMGAGMFLLILIAGSIYLVVKIFQYLPFYSLRLRLFIYKATILIRNLADRSLEPIITLKQWNTALRSHGKRNHVK